ncbi:putative membrane protein (TIGR02234 family) [Catenulispora sp. GAS73]|uniref:Trp biosynthesis-associated membrane protein n=1 Tax=Catenulispora sp. GAS73 TaxID=3156269 RepID=UPI0035151985
MSSGADSGVGSGAEAGRAAARTAAEHDSARGTGAGEAASSGAAEIPEAAATVPAQATGPTDPAQAARRAGRRELSTTVLIALLGGIIAWASAGRPWATGLAGVAPNTLKVTASGDDLSAGVTALGLTALAGALALFATQRLARRLVGVLLIAAGVGVAVYAFGERGASHASRVLADKAAAKGYATHSMDAHMASWWALAAFGGVLVALAGVAAVVRGATWPGMSSRYENAASKTAARAADTGTAKDLWDALDRGEDPTEPAEPTEAAEPAGATPRAEH